MLQLSEVLRSPQLGLFMASSYPVCSADNFCITCCRIAALMTLQMFQNQSCLYNLPLRCKTSPSALLTVLYELQLSLCLIKKPAKVIYAVKAHAAVVVTVMLGGVILLLYKVISGGDIVLQVSLSPTHAFMCQSAMAQRFG